MPEKHVILGLLELKERRNLDGQTAQLKWIVEALAVLLKSELGMIEAAESMMKEPANDKA